MTGGQLIAEYKNSTTYFVHDNNLGSSTILTSVAGAVGDCKALYPFGEQDNTICASSATTTHKFTGKERDSESNLDNFGARYYSSAQARFMTADWSAIPAPVPYANLGDPQTLNLYAYVGNNPLGKVDPDGHANQTPNDVPVGNVQSADISSSQSATGADKKQAQQQNQDQNRSGQQQSQQQRDSQQYHQALQQREQKFRDQQGGPAVGSPEYVAKFSQRVSADAASGEKQILGPAAAVEAVGVIAVVGTSATAEAAVASAGRAVDAAQTAVGLHQGMVQAALGATAAMTHSSPPRTPAGLAGYAVAKVIQFLGGF